MKALLRYCVIAFAALLLSSYAFAGEVQLKGEIAKIPSARILDWKGLTPTVNLEEGWQEEALTQGDVVCCPDGQGPDAYVNVALNRSGDNVVSLTSGTCLTINEADGSSADSVSQDSGEALFSLETLEAGSSFTVETPDATVGVTGTIFCVKVTRDLGAGVYSTRVGLLEVNHPNFYVIDKVDVIGLPNPDPDENALYTYLTNNQQLTINSAAANIAPASLSSGGWTLPPGLWKKKMGEIATKARGRKVGVYKKL
jgi:hypothetical protein